MSTSDQEFAALHSIPARFLMPGNRFAWQGETFTADDIPCPSDAEGHVVVNIVTDYDNAWIDVPTDAWVPLHHDDLNVGTERIVEVSAEETASPLSDQVTECGQAVDAAERAVHDGGISQEDSDRAERCARWNAEDAAAELTDDSSEGREQQ